MAGDRDGNDRATQAPLSGTSPHRGREEEAPRALHVEGATQAPLSGTSPHRGREEEAPRALHVEGATQAPLIAFSGVTKVYGKGNATVEALRGIDLCIEEGEFVAIMGPSGSGKSTCMNILGCLDTPTGGTYMFGDVDVGTLTRNQRALLRRHYQGFIFQGYNLLSRTSALENVELPLLYRGAGVRERRGHAMEALETVGLKGWESHTPSELSGGQQQRVAIARAIVTNPAVLLADEPTGNLDTARSREIMDVLTALNSDDGITIVMITHEPDMAVYAKRQVHFLDGLVVSDEPKGGKG
ncbi:MAG: ABC transporter ATP-binding protein [Syntrophorhabdaceae bacterium]|nr:ABC transporter ATP-binding protein [Syntrophorhabdaceae bacterium]